MAEQRVANKQQRIKFESIIQQDRNLLQIRQSTSNRQQSITPMQNDKLYTNQSSTPYPQESNLNTKQKAQKGNYQLQTPYVNYDQVLKKNNVNLRENGKRDIVWEERRQKKINATQNKQIPTSNGQMGAQKEIRNRENMPSERSETYYRNDNRTPQNIDNNNYKQNLNNRVNSNNDLRERNITPTQNNYSRGQPNPNSQINNIQDQQYIRNYSKSVTPMDDQNRKNQSSNNYNQKITTPQNNMMNNYNQQVKTPQSQQGQFQNYNQNRNMTSPYNEQIISSNQQTGNVKNQQNYQQNISTPYSVNNNNNNFNQQINPNHYNQQIRTPQAVYNQNQDTNRQISYTPMSGNQQYGSYNPITSTPMGNTYQNQGQNKVMTPYNSSGYNENINYNNQYNQNHQGYSKPSSSQSNKPFQNVSFRNPQDSMTPQNPHSQNYSQNLNYMQQNDPRIQSAYIGKDNQKFNYQKSNSIL